MKFLIALSVLSVMIMVPANAHAATASELLQQSGELVDQLNLGELNGADETIDAMADELAQLRSLAKQGTVDSDTLDLVAADLNGALEYLMKVRDHSNPA